MNSSIPRNVSLLFVFIFLFHIGITFGAENAIRLRNKTIVATPKQNAARPQNDSATNGLVLIQFTGAIQPEQKAELERNGVTLLRFVPENAFVARVKNTRLSQISALPFVTIIEPFRAEYKIHSSLTAPAARGVAPQALRVSVLISPDAQPADLATVRGALQKVEKESALRFGNILQGVVTPNQLNALANSPDVLWIEPAPKFKLFDEIGSKIVGGDDGSAGTRTVTQQLGFDGTGVRIAVADSGLMEGDAHTMHPDLFGRVDAFLFYGGLTDAADEHSHGTHVAGIIAGNAATGEKDDDGFLYGLGVAPGAHIVVQRIFDGQGIYFAPPSNETLTRDAVRAGAEIGSNSWGDDTQGRYDLSAAEFDELVRDADAQTAGDQPYILEFSAGNAGPGEQTIGSPAVAKNVIASGAVENDRFDLYIYDSGEDTMADFSSRGPCEDGRIKPDVVAPGTWIASLRSSLADDDNAWAPISNNYMYQGGTSQSGPHVSGAAAVFVQYYRQTITNATPSPALVKAALINSAVSLDEAEGNSPVPNNDEGWGRVDLTELIDSPRHYEFVDQTVLLTNSQTFEKKVLVASSDEPLKITLAYTDVPGFPAAIPALVNDLDLEVVSPNGSIFHGNQFAFEDGESVPGAMAFDNINNVEAVHISAPVPGEYLVRVRARNVVEDARRDTAAVDQDFALVISADIPLPGVGVLFFDKRAYSAPSVMNLKLIDFDLAGQSTATVHIKSSTESGGENFVLKAANNSGSFTGAVATVTGAPVVDGKIQVSHNDTIEASYVDASPTGIRIATARADLFPPVISNISVTNRFGRMVISWQTDEPSDSRVRYGTNSVLAFSSTNSALTMTHSIALDDLTAGATYQFFVASADEAGNTATNNNGGALFSFVAAKPGVILLVDEYTDPYFKVPPLSGYTNALNLVGLPYEIWDVAKLKKPPTFSDLHPFRAVIWRVPEFGPAFSTTERTAITNYLNNGGAMFVASMEILSRLDESGTAGGAFRTNVFRVTDYSPDAEVPGIYGSDSDPITAGIDIDLDYSPYEDDFKDMLGIPADISDTISISTNAAPILFDSSSDEIVGLRYPRVGEDSNGRFVFLSFPLDAVPTSGADPNNRANLLRNILSFLIPGVEGIGTIALDNSSYTIPSRIVVEVADSDLAHAGQTTVKFFSDTATNGVTITLSETVRPGLFRGGITLVASSNPVRPGELRAQHGDAIWAEYFDVSADGIARANAVVDTIAPVISNVSSEPDYQDALVQWNTSKRADSLVQFGESKFLGRTAYSPLQQTSHSVLVSGLEANRTYYFQVTSRDNAGNVVVDNNNGNFYTFKTLMPFYTPYTDNFDNNNTNWVVLTGEAGATWQLGVPNNSLETEAHSPPNAWGSNLGGKSIDIGDTTLASPAIDLSGGNRATLRFWHSYDFTAQSEYDIYEVGQVYCTTNNGSTWDLLAEFDDFSFGWEEAVIDLTAYVGRVIHIGFYYGFFSLDNGRHPGWLIDDVSITVTNSTTQFAFKSVTFTNGQAQLIFTAPAGSQYVIEASQDLINWTPLKTNTASSAESTFTDIQAANFPARFYRLRK